MKPRNFRFEPLLKYKAFIEETMKSEMTVIAETLELEEKRLFALEEIWGRAVEDLKERQKRQIPPHEIFMYHTYIAQISLDIELQRRRVVEVRKVYDEKRESLIGATQEKKIVEKVKEKDAQEMSEEVSRAEKKVMDEAAKNRYIRENCN